ncbi:hypothetical protein CPU09_01185 [Mammaliicoccus sciuri]|nr:hypothetical protein CPU09_01185 [Mammaliicoccus sciuri]
MLNPQILQDYPNKQHSSPIYCKTTQTSNIARPNIATLPNLATFAPQIPPYHTKYMLPADLKYEKKAEIAVNFRCLSLSFYYI